jgi:predicted TIM-barrel fold metal-dependent hydrolase
MLIDAHTHILSAAVVANVCQRKAMVADLHLEAHVANHRLTPEALTRAMQEAGVDLALHLVTAKAAGVSGANESALAVEATCPRIAAAGTLHPEYPSNPEQLVNLHAAGVRAIKLCSFSQGFQLDAPGALAMLEQIQHINRQNEKPFFVVLDTFFEADHHFGSLPCHITKPAQIAGLAKQFPGICFVGAHMGGLKAPSKMLLQDLPAAPNLYLDTSNAAHTLNSDVFVKLLKIHGPAHILFGSDWPWFHPRLELPLVDHLLSKAGFNARDRDCVFGENAAHLMGTSMIEH